MTEGPNPTDAAACADAVAGRYGIRGKEYRVSFDGKEKPAVRQRRLEKYGRTLALHVSRYLDTIGSNSR